MPEAGPAVFLSPVLLPSWLCHLRSLQPVPLSLLPFPAPATMPSSSDSDTVPPAPEDVPAVERTLFDDPDVLQAETTLHVAADHGLGVSRAAGAEARRASALRAEIARLQNIHDAVTAPNERTRRRLTRAALATRRVPVPGWALPGGQYWPMHADDIDKRRVVHMLSLGFSPAHLPQAALAAATAGAGDVAELPPRPPPVNNDDSSPPSSATVAPLVVRAPATPAGSTLLEPPRRAASPAAPVGPEVDGLWETDPALQSAQQPDAAPPVPPYFTAGAQGPPPPACAAGMVGHSSPIPHGTAPLYVPSTLGASSSATGGPAHSASRAGSPTGESRGNTAPSPPAAPPAAHLADRGGRNAPTQGGAYGGGSHWGHGGYGGAAPWTGGAAPWPSGVGHGHAPPGAVGGGGPHWGPGAGWGPWVYPAHGGTPGGAPWVSGAVPGSSFGVGGGGGGGHWSAPAPLAPGPNSHLLVPSSVAAPAWGGPDGFAAYQRRARVWLHTCNLPAAQQGGALLLSLTGLAAESAQQLPESTLFSVVGATALLEHLRLSFDAPASVKLDRASEALHTCTRGSGTMAAYLVKFRTAATRCATSGAALPDQYLRGLMLRNAGLSHEQQVMVQVTASASAAALNNPSLSETSAALWRLHGDVRSTSRADTLPTITLTAAEHAALVAAGEQRTRAGGPIICWHCHKPGHVRFNCPDRPRRDGAAVPPHPPAAAGPEGVPAAPAAGVAPAAAENVAGAPARAQGNGAAAANPHRVMLAAADNAPGMPAPAWAGYPILVCHASASETVLKASVCAVGDAIVDPGATATVAGSDWLSAYVSHLQPSLQALVTAAPASVNFRFGDHRTTLSQRHYVIPISLNGAMRQLGTYVIPGSLPLLISRPALVSARGVIDFEDNTLFLKDSRVTVPLPVNATGHLTLNLSPTASASALAVTTRASSNGPPAPCSPSDAAAGASPLRDATALSSPPPSNDATVELSGAADAPSDSPTETARPSAAGSTDNERATLSGADTRRLLAAGADLPSVLSRLHRTYAHPGAERLLQLLKDAGCASPGLAQALHRVTQRCSVCRANRSRPPRAVVTMPRPAAFNDTLAVDLAELAGRGQFLHSVDIGTRLSRCVIVQDKEAQTIVRALLSHWVCVYGAPRCLLMDPGREFDNSLLRVFAERFNIAVHVTAAQSAWSNGICERHNGVVKHMVTCLAADYPTASFQELLDHACFAKNSLSVHGCASPFQLATGSQPRVPSALSDAMPAMQAGHLPTEEDLAKTVALLAASRAAFSRAEASQSVRRALNRRVPGDPGRVYQPGDVVRYWEQSQSSLRCGMHGPATVVSQDGRVVRVRHGNAYKTRNASDVEPFHGPDPAPSPVADTGVVGSALSALRQAAAPHASAPVAAPVSPVAAVSLVVDGVCRATDYADASHALVTQGRLLADAADPPDARAHDTLTTLVASAQRDEGYEALIAHSVLVTRREMRARTEVAASMAGSRFDQAKEAELLAWMVQGAYKEVPFAGQRVLSTRWVLTAKPAALPGLLPRLKARLCARGNEDADKDDIDSFSPTVSRSTVRLLLILLATNGWVPHTVDVSTAFLQGMPIDRPRPVFVRPPPEARVPPGVVWQLAKCVYGLVDAPRMWAERVHALLSKIGAERAAGDPGLFVLLQEDRVILAVAVHVDDFLYGGSPEGLALFERELKAAFSVGPVESGAFAFTGLAISFSAGSASRPASVWVNQQAYVDSIDDIPVSAARAATLSAAVTTDELTLYRRATGALLWAAGQTLPHLACGAAVLARHFRHALVADLVRANKLIVAARCSRDLGLRLRPVGSSACLYLFTDSSAVSLRSTSAQTGFSLFLGEAAGVVAARGTTSSTVDGAAADLVAWGSHRQRRVTHSSFAAEAFSLLQGLLVALVVADVAGLLLHGRTGAGLPVHAFIDSRSLYDSLTSSSETGSKEVRAAIADLRDHYRMGSLASLTWLPAHLQLSDGLTKPNGAASLRSAVATGWLPLPVLSCVTKSSTGVYKTRP